MHCRNEFVALLACMIAIGTSASTAARAGGDDLPALRVACEQLNIDESTPEQLAGVAGRLR